MGPVEAKRVHLGDSENSGLMHLSKRTKHNGPAEPSPPTDTENNPEMIDLVSSDDESADQPQPSIRVIPDAHPASRCTSPAPKTSTPGAETPENTHRGQARGLTDAVIAHLGVQPVHPLPHSNLDAPKPKGDLDTHCSPYDGFKALADRAPATPKPAAASPPCVMPIIVPGGPRQVQDSPTATSVPGDPSAEDVDELPCVGQEQGAGPEAAAERSAMEQAVLDYERARVALQWQRHHPETISLPSAPPTTTGAATAEATLYANLTLVQLHRPYVTFAEVTALQDWLAQAAVEGGGLTVGVQSQPEVLSSMVLVLAPIMNAVLHEASQLGRVPVFRTQGVAAATVKLWHKAVLCLAQLGLTAGAEAATGEAADTVQTGDRPASVQRSTDNKVIVQMLEALQRAKVMADELRCALQQKHAENEELKETVKKKDDELAGLVPTVDMMRSGHTRVMTELRARTEAQKKVEASLETAEKDAEQRKLELAALKAETTTQNKSIVQMLEELQRSKVMADELKWALQQKHAENEELKETVKKKDDEVAGLVPTVDMLRSGYTRVMTELRARTEAQKKVEASLETAERDAEQLKSELAALKAETAAQLAAKDAELDAVRVQLQQEKAKAAADVEAAALRLPPAAPPGMTHAQVTHWFTKYLLDDTRVPEQVQNLVVYHKAIQELELAQGDAQTIGRHLAQRLNIPVCDWGNEEVVSAAIVAADKGETGCGKCGCRKMTCSSCGEKSQRPKSWRRALQGQQGLFDALFCTL